MEIDEALEKGFLIREPPDQKLILKELKEAEYDLTKAQSSLSEKDFKWAIVKSYYSMFHAARAVLFKMGYREKRHFVVPVVLNQLVGEGKLEASYVSDYNAAIFSREQADYHYGYSEESARQMVGIANRFVNRLKILSRQK